MNPELNTQAYLLNHYHRQHLMENAQRERLVAVLPRRAGRVDVLMAHVGRGMVAIGQRMQQQPKQRFETDSIPITLPAFDNG